MEFGSCCLTLRGFRVCFKSDICLPRTVDLSSPDQCGHLRYCDAVIRAANRAYGGCTIVLRICEDGHIVLVGGIEEGTRREEEKGEGSFFRLGLVSASCDPFVRSQFFFLQSRSR